MKVVVVGAGAVGGFYGALLAEAGHAVVFVARGPHGRAMAEQGLMLHAPDGTRTLRVDVVSDIGAVAADSVDLALVTVKAPDLASVAPGVDRALRSDGVAIPLLNGLDSERDLARVVGPERVIGGIAQVASAIERPGCVRVRAAGRVILAPLRPADLPRVQKVAEQWTAAGIPCTPKEDLQRVLWTKLLWNAPFNAACAITRLPAGAVLQIPALRALVAMAIGEVAAVAAASGVALPVDVAEPLLAATDTQFAESVPSMLQDVLRGKPTEVEALQGGVVRRGKELDVPTPTLDALYALILGIERARVTARA